MIKMLLRVFTLTMLFIIVVQCRDAEIVRFLQDRLTAASGKSDLVMEDSLQDAFPFLKSTCMKNALEFFLPLCLKQGIESIDSVMRVETAVKLSICEFDESGLDAIPASCKSPDLDSLMSCMIQLESSDRWWTTYSGNYQRLPTICFENALPYEKEQILRLFLNITDIYEDFNEGLKDKLFGLLSKVEQASNKYRESSSQVLKENLENYTEDAKFYRMELKKEFQGHKEEIEELVLYNKEVFSANFEKKDTELIEVLNHVRSLIQDVETALLEKDFATKVENEKLKELERWHQVDEVSLDVLQSLYSGKNQLNIQLEDLLNGLIENFTEINQNLEYTQQHALQAFTDHDNTIREFVLSALRESALDFRSSLMTEWQQTSRLITDDITVWNDEIHGHFRSIMLDLNGTLDKVNDLNEKVSALEVSVSEFLKLFNLSLRCIRFIFNSAKYILLKRKTWLMAPSALFFYRVCYKTHAGQLNYLLRNIVKHVFMWLLIIFATYIGSKCGTLLT